MRKHAFHQMGDVSDFELESVVRTIGTNESAFPPFLDQIEKFRSVVVLTYREARSHFPTESMSSTRLKRDAEATFAIYESSYVGINIHHDKYQGRRIMEC
jgi:hypothetical protein